MKWGNCLCWALAKWRKHGGYLVIRRSRYGWFPHFLHMDREGNIESFVPDDPKRKKLPPPVFKGSVKRGD